MYQLANLNSRIFPNTSSFFIFWAYISLFVTQGLLVKAIHKSETREFIVIVLLQELVKLLICIAIYLVRSQANVSLLKELASNRKLLPYYLVPAFLYCLYNNLTFVNLKLYDLATYYCLMQFRIVLTAIIYQILFSRKLNITQWISLIVLTVGCLVKEYGLYVGSNATHHRISPTNDTSITNNATLSESAPVEADTKHLTGLIWSTLLILLQMFCSCFAGVYNEYLLKDVSTAKSADVIMQNMFMYIDSIICNLIAYGLYPQSQTGDDKSGSMSGIEISISLLTNPLVVALIVNNALSGLAASFFLKSLNSILKTFASALELFAITIFAWILFGDHVDITTITALFLVSVAIIIYSKNPVSTAPPEKGQENRADFELLPDDEEED